MGVYGAWVTAGRWRNSRLWCFSAGKPEELPISSQPLISCYLLGILEYVRVCEVPEDLRVTCGKLKTCHTLANVHDSTGRTLRNNSADGHAAVSKPRPQIKITAVHLQFAAGGCRWHKVLHSCTADITDGTSNFELQQLVLTEDVRTSVSELNLEKKGHAAKPQQPKER